MSKENKIKTSLTFDREVLVKLEKYALARERSISWCVNNFMKERFNLGKYKEIK
jgi:hypothetical protein